jgi:hypothetical protein
MRRTDSAFKHGIDVSDMEYVVEFPFVVVPLREEPEKLLYIGLDTKLRPLEVITDTSGEDGKPVIIHADKLTKVNEKYLGGKK